MAGMEETISAQDEASVPVFTVMKNGVILKNIFIINSAQPPSFPELQSFSSLKSVEITNQENEEISIVGRHPDCNIMLTHPSISRFHFRIHSNSSSKKLFVVDLSSVHGTWVRDERIDPGVPIELKDGDTLRVGGSSRVYVLHWVPLSSAYVFDYPFVPAVDGSSAQEKEKENAILEEEISVEMHQEDEKENANLEEEISVEMHQEDEKSLVVENKETLLLDSILEDLHSLFLEAKLETDLMELMSSSLANQEIKSSKSHSELTVTENSAVPLEEALVDVDDEIKSSIPHPVITGMENLLLSVEEPFADIENQLACKVNPNPESVLNIDIFIGKDNPVQEEISDSVMTEKDEADEIPKESQLTSGEVSVETANGFVSQENQIWEIERKRYENSTEKSRSDVDYMRIGEEKHGAVADEISVGEKQDEEKDEAAEIFIGKDNPVQKEVSDIVMTEKDEADEIPKESQLTSGEVSAETANRFVCQENQIWEIERKKYENSTEKSRSNVDYMCIGEEKHGTVADERSVGEKQDEEKDEAAEIPEDSQLTTGEVYAETENRSFSLENQTWEFQREMHENSCKKSRSNVGYRCIDEEKHSTLADEVSEKQNLVEKQDEEKDYPSLLSPLLEAKLVDFSLAEVRVILEAANKKESQTLQSFFGGEALSENHLVEKNSPAGSIWSRRGKSTTNIKIQTGRSTADGNARGAVLMDENKEETDSKLISRMQVSHLDEEEEEIFTPDKENFTPNTLLEKSLRKKGNGKKSSSKSISSKTLDKENQTPPMNMILQDLKFEKHPRINGARLGKEKTLMKRQVERMPFQSLLNSAGKSSSEAAVSKSANRSSNSFAYTQAIKAHDKVHLQTNYRGNKKRSWTMVADITSLLNKESLKSLQLLQGLNGTRLIIPRMVINELDCLKRCGSFFRRTAKASSVLEWIEECMEKTKWWIHVQSTVEDGNLIAPTPPASPQFQYSEGNGGFSRMTIGYSPFITRGSFMEIVSPTTEDHILDCALHFKKVQDDAQIVLLSNDLTLKIKAMAEGMICERAEEFHDSLVNPFSSRFLWTGSSPRGLTWSGSDDVVLKQRYDNCSLKKPLKGENAKGLKLILLHNSHYGSHGPWFHTSELKVDSVDGKL